MSEIVSVAFACNDHRDGTCLHRFDQVSFEMDGERWLKLAGVPTVVRPMGGRRLLQVGIKRVRIQSWHEWVGNWCWDEAQMSLPDALRVAAHLIEQRAFTAGPFDAIAARAWGRHPLPREAKP